MKRFCGTEKWSKPWFRKLSPKLKCFLQYIWDNCDCAGVWEPDFELAGLFIGQAVTESEALECYSDEIEILPDGKWWITGFIRFQYGKLSRLCKPHSPVFVALARHGLKEELIGQNDEYSNTVDGYMREKILARDELTCVYSGVPLKPWEAEIDHIIPRSKGGSNKPENLAIIAKHLNALKAELSVQDFCAVANLDYTAVSERLSKAISKPSKGLRLSLKEEDKEEDKDKKEKGSGEKPKIENLKSKAMEVLGYLNRMAGRRFETCDAHLKCIEGRITDTGGDVLGICEMIDRQVKRWKGTEQEEYIRPITLFNKTKFRGYYDDRNRPVVAQNGHRPARGLPPLVAPGSGNL